MSIDKPTDDRAGQLHESKFKDEFDVKATGGSRYTDLFSCLATFPSLAVLRRTIHLAAAVVEAVSQGHGADHAVTGLSRQRGMGSVRATTQSTTRTTVSLECSPDCLLLSVVGQA